MLGLPSVADLLIRNVDPEVRDRIKSASAARGITMGAYIERIAGLHVAANNALAEGRDPGIKSLLAAFDLSPVTN